VKIRASLAAAFAALVVAACGGGGSSSEQSTPTSPSTPAATAAAGAGKDLFAKNCSTCHTLADAGATGKVGPNLDQLRPGPDLVQHQVTNGGGGMPAFGNKLSQDQIKQIAAYVSGAAGRSH